MPDDGLLVDVIPRIAPTAELHQRAAGQQPDAPLLAEGSPHPPPQGLKGGHRADGDLHANEQALLDVPGTTIFDADQACKGYWLNQFCMSLMKAENRERFKPNLRAYLD